MTSIAESHDENALSALGEAFETAAGSLGSARANATEHAKIAAAKVQSTVSAGAYHGAYGLSYGVVFTAVFLKEFLPRNSAVRRGFEEGAEAAFDAVAARQDDAEYDRLEPSEAIEAEEVESKPVKRATKRIVRSAKTED
jgi:hypothetical protein